MNFRESLDVLAARGELARVSAPVSVEYEIAGLLKKIEPRPALFETVSGSAFRVAGNIFPAKSAMAAALGWGVRDLIPRLTDAIDNPRLPQVVAGAPCQEVVDESPDLDRLPILLHCRGDGGRYISSGVVIARHPQHGLNVDFHRCMQISPTEMAMRVVKGRHFDAYLNELGQVEVAVVVGAPPAVLAAAATSVEMGVNELEIAAALDPLMVVPARSVDVLVPAEAEFIIEGVVYRDRRHAEGPFVDLTETADVVRQEPVLAVRAITHRRDAIWHALLPGGLEHKLLMGMPREPTIFRQVSRVARCLDVNVSPGGCSWLHAVVQIDKRNEDDGLRAIEAAFAGHRSCKHVYVVDADIDPYDPLQVEWAMATRFQASRGLVIKPPEPGSSLDPSAEPGSHLTSKVGFDLTKPLHAKGKNFEKTPFPDVDLSRFGLS
jgi:UbiD family decarboxylase